MKTQEENEDDENENEDDITRTNEHYSGSYLDTYSTLMDIPQIMGNDGDEDGSDVKQSENYQENQDENLDKTEEEDEEEDRDDADSDDENEQMPSSVHDSIKMIMRRLDNMESRMDQQFQTINARLTIMEGKVKFVESHQTSQSKSSTDNGEPRS